MANRPKGKLFALLAIFVAIGLVTASGAFTSVSAQRVVSVQTAGDAAANVQFQDVSGGNYFSTDGNGEFSLDFSNVNLNATTEFGAVFNVSAPGFGDVTFYIADEPNEVGSGVDAPTPTLGDTLTFTNASDSSIEGSGNSMTITGGTSEDVHIAINTTDGTTQNFNGTIVIVVENSG